MTGIFVVMSKRLFLFAAFIQDGIVDDALVYYVRALSRVGDVVFCMDSSCEETEISKLKPYVLQAMRGRHYEYDFGSYKRDFLWARDNLNLQDYDFVYLVNDSVYGPIANVDLENVLVGLEAKGDFIGMVENADAGVAAHIQSWFVGVSRKIANSGMFADFMMSITRQDNKSNIVAKYEVGLSQMIVKNFHVDIKTIFKQDARICNHVYRHPWIAMKNGVPFIKKTAVKNMLSKRFLKKYIGNDKLYKNIISTGVWIRFRPFKLLQVILSGF